MQSTEPDPNKRLNSVQQIRNQINGVETEDTDQSSQNNAEQQRRVVELLGVALTRLNGRSGLSKTAEQRTTAIPQCGLCPSKRQPFHHPDPTQRSELR